MDKCRGNNDTATKVLGKVVNHARDAEIGNSAREDREDGENRRGDENDEEGANSGAHVVIRNISLLTLAFSHDVWNGDRGGGMGRERMDLYPQLLSFFWRCETDRVAFFSLQAYA